MFRRPMAFGGAWYPADPGDCEASIRRYQAEPLPAGLPRARLGVVPHAGWMFSGALAGRVFQALDRDPGVELVVVLGGHLGAGDPVVAMVEGEWQTPFGPFTIYEGFSEALDDFPRVVLEREGTCRSDNSTELQLPFARYRYPKAELLPLRLPPDETALRVGRTLADHLHRSSLKAVVVASTDLTHYGPNYGFEPHGRGGDALAWVETENDAAFIAALEAGDGAELLATARQRRCACSAGAAAALAELAGPQARFHQLGYTNSARVAPRDLRNFVGYVGGVYA